MFRGGGEEAQSEEARSRLVWQLATSSAGPWWFGALPREGSAGSLGANVYVVHAKARLLQGCAMHTPLLRHLGDREDRAPARWS